MGLSDLSKAGVTGCVVWNGAVVLGRSMAEWQKQLKRREGPGARWGILEQRGAFWSAPERPGASRSFPERPQASWSALKRPGAFRIVLERPGAPWSWSVLERPGAFWSVLGTPWSALESSGAPCHPGAWGALRSAKEPQGFIWSNEGHKRDSKWTQRGSDGGLLCYTSACTYIHNIIYIT